MDKDSDDIVDESRSSDIADKAFRVIRAAQEPRTAACRSKVSPTMLSVLQDMARRHNTTVSEVISFYISIAMNEMGQLPAPLAKRTPAQEALDSRRFKHICDTTYAAWTSAGRVMDLLWQIIPALEAIDAKIVDQLLAKELLKEIWRLKMTEYIFTYKCMGPLVSVNHTISVLAGNNRRAAAFLRELHVHFKREVTSRVPYMEGKRPKGHGKMPTSHGKRKHSSSLSNVAHQHVETSVDEKNSEILTPGGHEALPKVEGCPTPSE